MKAHQVARALRILAEILETAPNEELTTDLSVNHSRMTVDNSTLAVSLSTLANLARIDKRQWLTFVTENNFPLHFRERDASRDILGKVLAYLEKNPDAQERLKQSFRRRATQTSPELMRAFAFLLGETK
jgi:hypothetical protein